MSNVGLLPLKRFFHWGPIVAIGIIKCVTLTTLYMNSMWWPPHTSFGGLINQAIFLLSSSLAAFNYILATLTGPGFLPVKWHPKIEKHEKYLQYCNVCEGYKAPRSHHCRKCGRCVKKMDHHCPWINTCVGWANHAYFTSFLAFAVLGSMQAAIVLSICFYRGINRSWYLYSGQFELATVHFGISGLLLCVLSLGLSVGVVFAVGMLFVCQIRAIFRNRTGIEDWILEKAKYRREGTDKPFIFPYDLGIRNNITQVMNWTCAPIGDGIQWDVHVDCSQYTLTREQIAQKNEKRERTRTYTIQKKVSGSWCPLWSQGCMVCLNPPYTDESRITLQLGDLVKVTRWKKHWLFGEKVEKSIENTEEPTSSSTSKKALDRCRGWFPRRCAVELVEPDSDEHLKHFKHKNKHPN